MSHLSNALILGFIVGVVGLGISVAPFGIDLEENVALELLFHLRGVNQAPSDVVIVSIDQESAHNLNIPNDPRKWPRSLHARLTENLAKRGAAVIAFDLIFDESKSPGEDKLFAETIRKAGNVLLCEYLKRDKVPLGKARSMAASLNIETVIPPIPLLAQSAVGLAPFPLPKVPVKVSQYWTFKTETGGMPTLPVVAFQIFAMPVYGEFIRLLKKVSPSQAERLIMNDKEAVVADGSVGNLIRQIKDIFENEPGIAKRMLKELQNSRAPPADAKKVQILKSLIKMYQGSDSRYLNFYGSPGTIPSIPYYQALELSNKAFLKQKQFDFAGKAVFVGLSDRSRSEQKDGFHTVFSESSGLDISGVEIAATAFSNLLEDKPLKSLNLYSCILIILLWGILLGIICRISPISVSALSVIGLGVLYVIVAKYQFKANNTWFPTIIPLLLQTPLAFFGAVVWNYIDINKERQNIKKALRYHLPKEVVDQIAKDIVQIETGTQVVYGICLFTDVEQYTTLSETMDPMDLGRFIHRYYETMFTIVEQHGGYIAGVIGDSMLAIWASKGSEAALRQKACSAAMGIKKELKLFGQSSEVPKIKTRIGLHCGQILLGHIGAVDHYEYTPIGDIVNTASRIEGLNKDLGTGILVSDEMLHQLNGFLTRELGKFRLAGKINPVVIYELLGHEKKVDEKLIKGFTIFAEALGAFRRQSWDEAIEKFSQSIEEFGEDTDRPSRFYIELCNSYKKNPPEEPWDGVVRMVGK